MDSMSSYRKKPVVIEAWHWMLPPDEDPGPDWLWNAFDRWPQVGGAQMWPHGNAARSDQWAVCPHIAIVTLEGEHLAQPGDWIIRGVQGELYPCKPDIFEATYEPVTGSEERPNIYTVTPEFFEETDEEDIEDYAPDVENAAPQGEDYTDLYPLNPGFYGETYEEDIEDYAPDVENAAPQGEDYDALERDVDFAAWALQRAFDDYLDVATDLNAMAESGTDEYDELVSLNEYCRKTLARAVDEFVNAHITLRRATN
jgi:hypothetical protein